jgi:hypothetical protein
MLAVLAVAASSQAAVIITQEGVPTDGMPGFTTWTLTASTDGLIPGEQIQGFDFASQPAFGFFGAMNQVNPFGLATIFEDNNAAISATSHVSRDSQFKFTTSEVTVPAGFSSEGPNQLRSVFAAGAPLGTSVPFVQLAIPDAILAPVLFAGQVQTVRGTAVVDNSVAGSVPGVPIIPEPATMMLAGLAAIGLVGLRRRQK